LLIVGDAIPYGSHIKWVQDSGDGFLLGLVSRNSKASTVDFTDSHGGICPQSASFIFSSGQEFAIVAPVHAGPLDSKEEKNEESSLFLFGNEACRYKITLKKFVWKSGRETQLPLRSRDALKRGVEAELRTISKEAMSAKTGSQAMLGCAHVKLCRERAEWERADFYQNDVPAEAIFPVDMFRRRGDATELVTAFASPAPGRNSDTSELRPSFDRDETREHPNYTLEFWGVMHFASNGFTIYVIDPARRADAIHVPSYTVTAHRHRPRKTYEIDIANSQTRINLSVKKEAFADGWTTVFGE